MALADDIRGRASELLAKISDAEPAGQNASFDPRYEAVRNDMASLDSPTGGEVEWSDIEKSTRGLLTSASKDLLVASYFTYALLEVEGVTGLAVGLATLDGLFEQYWETMFPPARRLRGRGNALGWLVDRLEPKLPQLDLQPSDRAAVDLVDELWKALGGKAREKLEDHSPPMSGVANALTRLKLKLPEATPEPQAPAAIPPSPEPSPTAASPAATPPAATPAAPDSAAAPNPAPAAPAAPPPAESTDPVESLLEEAATWLEPIAGGPPAGSDARYEPEYEACRVEVAQLDAPTGGDPDWKSVEDQASTILKTKAKDVLMGSYFAYARYRHRGLSALPLGLVVLEQTIDRYHEGLFPSRPRGRGNATAWLLTQLESALGAEPLGPDDRPTVLALDAAYKKLAATLRTRFEDHAPGTSPMSDRIKRMLLAVPEKKPEPPKPAAPPPRAPTTQAPKPAPRPAAAAAPMPTAAASVSNAEDVNKFLLETGRSLTKAAGVLRRAELSNAAAYRLIRAGLWLHLHNPPPSDAGGKTQIPPLPENRRDQFNTILANSKWAAAIEETESALMQFRFCLDLNRMTDHALEQLGDAYAPARNALAGEVAALLRRMPELPELSAGDGSPLADPDTKAWLDTLTAAQDGGEGAGSADSSAADRAAMAEVKAGMANKPLDAMKLARERIDEAGTPRSRFVRQLTLAEICLTANQPLLARGMFAGLDRDITARNLLEWEPDLAGRCLEGLVRSIRAANKAGGKFTGADGVFERLCLVDPAAAARLSG